MSNDLLRDRAGRRRRAVRWLALCVVVLTAVIGSLAYTGRLDLHAVGRTLTDLHETSLDVTLAAKVRSALALSRRVSGLEIDVEAQGGTVILHGFVPSAETAAIAEAIAADTSGVTRVESRLEVDAAVASSLERTLLQRVADLEARVASQERLAREPLLSGTDLHVRVEDGEVVIEGRVDNELQRASAQSIAEAIAGSAALRNQIETRVGHDSGAGLARRVEFELYATDAFVLEEIAVEAEGSVVRLDGVVWSEAERLLAERLAVAVPGVRQVVNELQLMQGTPAHP
jgi:osmotically-inducible protein OsmY